MTKMYRSTTDRRIAGVCGGISEIFNIDSTIVRLLLVALMFSPFPAAVSVFYIGCWAIIPEDPGYKKQ